ncbi:MAG: helicase C-terminal domain-containing protein [Nanoarchaeota archaeon]|mgnify:CR=1 FL=1
MKYRTLEQLITSPEGPVAQNEKFVIFSMMFREGVTQKGHEELKKRYNEMGVPHEYEKLQLDKTLQVILEESLKRKFRKDVPIGVIDGTIPVEEREKIIDGLENGLGGIFCTAETGGESLDFTAANWTYFLDEHYVPDKEQQAIWRQLRKRQKRKVFVNHVRADNSLDIHNRDYVDKKRIIAKMGMDGVPPTAEEWSLLGDTEGKKFGELVKNSIGGVSINVHDAPIENIYDFEIKKRTRSSKKASGFTMTEYATTDAQKIMQLIGQNPLGCWQDPAFVELYMKALPNLSPHVVHTAKICDLITRAKTDEIVFPRKIVSEGSGPSLLYNSYQALKPVLKKNNIALPYIVDRDSSQLMLDNGNNPNQVLGDMAGKNSSFKKGQFDMVDNESISLLKDAMQVHSSLLEAHRILKPRGLVELIVKNMKFQDTFYSGMENLGFELLSEKNQGFSLSRDAFRRLRKSHGEHFAESYSAKLANTYMLLARKIDDPATVNPDNFWFETLGQEEPEESVRDPRESKSIIVVGKNGRSGRSRKTTTHDENGNGQLRKKGGRIARVGLNGVVESIEDGGD